MVRIGGAQGFWGDRNEALKVMISQDQVDFVSLDYLAELTLSIMQRQKQKNPQAGYARDFLVALEMALPYWNPKDTKIITNAGGINIPQAVLDLKKLFSKCGFSCRIAYITGDDLTDKLEELRSEGIDFTNAETGESFETIKDRIIAANVYYGHSTIKEALDMGADLVITGRATDSSLFLAPLAHRFNWREDQWRELATGIAAGHLLECGAQVTGGNYDFGWENVPNLENLGYPIAEISTPGELILTKCKDTGGTVTEQTCKEQLLYEIHDPSSYVTPDVTVDLSGVIVERAGVDRVQVKNIQGKPKPEKLKLCIGFFEGYKIEGYIPYAWPKALSKAKKSAEIILNRLSKNQLMAKRTRVDFVGVNSLLLDTAALNDENQLNEVVLRIALFTEDKKEAEKLSFELAPMILNGPPGACFFGGRPRPTEMYGLWTTYIPRESVKLKINWEEMQ